MDSDPLLLIKPRSFLSDTVFPVLIVYERSTTLCSGLIEDIQMRSISSLYQCMKGSSPILYTDMLSTSLRSIGLRIIVVIATRRTDV